MKENFQIKEQTSGTTISFVIIDGWTVTVESVGDSRYILESPRGLVCLLSADHGLEANLEERERIMASGGEIEARKERTSLLSNWNTRRSQETGPLPLLSF